MSLTDKVKIPVECPTCGKKTERSLTQLTQTPTVTCVCGTLIKVSGVKAVADPFKDLERSLKKAGAKLKR